jgi:endonuclease-8
MYEAQLGPMSGEIAVCLDGGFVGARDPAIVDAIGGVFARDRPMSEGPEVRRTADRLAEALCGKPIEAVEFRRKSGGLPPAIAGRIIGARVKGVRTFGKHLVIDFTRGVHLHNHMMMFGKWRIYAREPYDAGKAKPPPRSKLSRAAKLPPGVKRGPIVDDVRDDSRVRLVLVTPDTVAVEFNGPVLSFTTCDPAKRASIVRLGPDALSRPFDARDARRRLRDREHMKLADLLLDQTFVAGIGNKYKSEILWRLGLDPFMRAGDLARAEVSALLKTIPAVLRGGYAAAGRTRPLEPGESAASWNHRHFVFRRGGRPCWRCATTVKSDRSRSARVTFYCPACQPERAARVATSDEVTTPPRRMPRRSRRAAASSKQAASRRTSADRKKRTGA